MQGKDKLEGFIAENREAFDSETPPKRNWSNIEDQLGISTENRAPKTPWYWKAAVVLLLGAVSFLLIDKYDFMAANGHVSNVEKFKEMETFYTSLIENKEQRLASEIASKETSILLEVEIKELDEIYSELKELFFESQPSEQVLERLVHLLRQKLHVIDSQLELIEKAKAPQENKPSSNVSM